MADPELPGEGVRKTLRSGKMAASKPSIKQRPQTTKGSSKPSTRNTTAFWLLGEPVSMKFWSDETDEEGNILPAFPDMTGKKLPTEMDAMRHMAYLRQFRPKTPVYELALETCDVAAVYWKMAKIPVQELSDKKAKLYYGADRLSNLWQEYQVL